MVKLVISWEDFIQVAENCRYGTIQLKHLESAAGPTVQIRVQAGSYAFISEDILVKSETYRKIRAYADNHRFIELIGSMPDEAFFK